MRSTREIEADYHLLEVITAIADSVQEPLNAEHIGISTLNALSAHFRPTEAYLHSSDSIQKAFHMLSFYASNESIRPNEKLQYIPYASPMFIAQAHDHHTPLRIEEMHSALKAGRIQETDPLLRREASGIVCVPLWFGDQFEGALTAIFKEPISAQDPETLALERSGTHIAAALAHAHLQLEAENERTRLRTVLDQLPEGVLITEASNGLVSYANSSAEHLLDVPHPELVGRHLDKHLQGRSNTKNTYLNIQPWNFMIVRALAGETVKTQETSVTKQDGSILVSLCSSAPLYSANGILTGAVLVFQDVTQQKSLEQRKNELISLASHELRTPITAIQGIAEILQMYSTQNKQISDARIQRSLRQISIQSKHLTNLIEDMLDLSRIEHSRFTLKKTPVDLVSLLKDIIESQSTLNQNHHLFLSLEEGEGVASLVTSIDRERITQVLNNLINNAVKYSDVGTTVEVGLRLFNDTNHPLPSTEALIWVKDSGIGIAKEHIPHIFEYLYRSRMLRPRQQGLGIGLFIVHEIITCHEGRVWVDSEPQKGSTFYISLPVQTLPQNEL